MKRFLACMTGLILLFSNFERPVTSLPRSTSIVNATTNDLAADWTDGANPNGVWTYREGTNALPSVANWTPLGSAVVQPAWAPSSVGGNFLPAWFQSTADNAGGLDALAGDVVVHSTDSFNGSSNGIANVIWTSPENGVINISGAVWPARDIGRSNRWSLLLNGTSLTDGNISSGDPFARSNPFNFANGSGGPAALTGLAVSAGDVVELRIVKTSEFGDFVGVNLTVSVGIPPQQCVGAVGSQCGFPVKRNRDGSYTGTVSVGSILHDNCCIVNFPNGRMCNNGGPDQTICQAEWDKAVSNFGSRRGWVVKSGWGPYGEGDGDDITLVPARTSEPQADKETMATWSLAAPSGTKLDPTDADFCASRRFRATNTKQDYGTCF